MLDFRELADGNIRITLLKNGRRFVLTDKLDNLKIKRPIAWDGKWRLVIFDIPHDQRRARDAFREKLTDLGFHQLQKSVFIIPFPCEKELDFIMTYWNVQDHVLLLYVSSFEGEAKLKHHFGL
ncbi:MAG: CRISPR-associated endonuclease Cas2 [Candidatus Liptonbacteria bacterium]|nr:CRISPR-associated endonuclease Cas2 [Candidatus Liptonbacteria bacterium]